AGADVDGTRTPGTTGPSRGDRSRAGRASSARSGAFLVTGSTAVRVRRRSDVLNPGREPARHAPVLARSDLDQCRLARLARAGPARVRRARAPARTTGCRRGWLPGPARVLQPVHRTRDGSGRLRLVLAGDGAARSRSTRTQQLS